MNLVASEPVSVSLAKYAWRIPHQAQRMTEAQGQAHGSQAFAVVYFDASRCRPAEPEPEGYGPAIAVGMSRDCVASTRERSFTCETT